MLSSAAILFLSATIIAQPPQSTIPESVLEQVEYFDGKWEYEIQFPGRTTKGVWTAKLGPDKTHQMIRVSRTTRDGGVIETVFISGWDSGKNQVMQLGFGKSGHTLYRYSLVSDTVWEGTISGSAAGKPVTAKVRLDKQPNAFTATFTNNLRGDVAVPDYIMRFRRIKKKQ